MLAPRRGSTFQAHRAVFVVKIQLLAVLRGLRQCWRCGCAPIALFQKGLKICCQKKEWPWCTFRDQDWFNKIGGRLPCALALMLLADVIWEVAQYSNQGHQKTSIVQLASRSNAATGKSPLKALSS